MFQMTWMKSINLVLVGTLLVGCSHTLEVKNIAEYKSDSLVQKINKPISIGKIGDAYKISS